MDRERERERESNLQKENLQSCERKKKKKDGDVQEELFVSRSLSPFLCRFKLGSVFQGKDSLFVNYTVVGFDPFISKDR